MENIQLVWFRSDLRITDNPALFNARETNQPIIALFFICEKQWQKHNLGIAKVDFMLRQIIDLKTSLAELNIPLLVKSVDYFDDMPKQLLALCNRYDITKVWCNHEYEVNEIARDAACRKALATAQVAFEPCHDQCVLAPNTIKTKDGTMYKVFTPFFKRWQDMLLKSPIECLPHPVPQDALSISSNDVPKLKHYLTDELSDKVQDEFCASEVFAMKQLQTFIDERIHDYTTIRNIPNADGTSLLSPYLAIGSISARQCYVAAQNHCYNSQLSDVHKNSIQQWLSELCWRDFYRHIIYAYPAVVKGAAFNPHLDAQINWRYNPHDFELWRCGRTGVPLVDAAMRCLNATNFMHNRLRMVVAMFLTKNLLIDWRLGEAYFMSKLVDADFSSNNGGWQWSASVGTDAAPYFRIMNPFSQAKSHDPDALFIKRWLPELNNLKPSIIHDAEKLNKIAESIGYVSQMVDVKQSRKDAIAAFKQAKLINTKNAPT